MRGLTGIDCRCAGGGDLQEPVQEAAGAGGRQAGVQHRQVRTSRLQLTPPWLLLAFFRSTDLPLPRPALMMWWCRDSKDPGALGVFASGGRLPPPRPANELLRKFNGPVLVAQGALDPLNDAKGRAELLRTCYDKTVVRLIEAGHCPHVSTPHPTAEQREESTPSPAHVCCRCRAWCVCVSVRTRTRRTCARPSMSSSRASSWMTRGWGRAQHLCPPPAPHSHEDRSARFIGMHIK